MEEGADARLEVETRNQTELVQARQMLASGREVIQLRPILDQSVNPRIIKPADDP